MRHGLNSCSGVLVYTSPSVLQFARAVTIGLSRKTGWPDRSWRLCSSTTTTSLTNFNSLGVMRPENPGEIVSGYNLQWVARIPRAHAAAVPGEANPSQSQPEAATRHCHSRTGPEVPLGQRTGPSATACRVGGLRRVEVRQGGAGQGRCANSEEGTERPQLAEQEGFPQAGTWRSEVQS